MEHPKIEKSAGVSKLFILQRSITTDSIFQQVQHDKVHNYGLRELGL